MQEDAREIQQGKPYHWKDWSIIRGRDCLYIWSDAAALELSNGSNGWFRFILDGKLATMYSSGSPEGGSDSSGSSGSRGPPADGRLSSGRLILSLSSPPAESRSEFLEKLQRARSQVKPVTSSQPILSNVAPTKLTVGNWSLTCLKEGEIAIHNSDGQQATILKEDLPGFVFESNRGTKHSFTAETSLGEQLQPLLSPSDASAAGEAPPGSSEEPTEELLLLLPGSEFVTGWTGKRGRKLKSKLEKTKQKVKSMARELYDDHFKAVESMPRGVVVTLRNISTQLESAWELHTNRQVCRPVLRRLEASLNSPGWGCVSAVCGGGEHVEGPDEDGSGEPDCGAEGREHHFSLRDVQQRPGPGSLHRPQQRECGSPPPAPPSGWSLHNLMMFCGQSVELDLKRDCKPLMERINVFKAAFSENEDNERCRQQHTQTLRPWSWS